MKKAVVASLLIVLLGILYFQQAAASFVCGKVNNSKDFSAAGLDANVYYSENPVKQTSCRISSAENKYCCDLENIKEVSWKKGKTAIGEIFDAQEGYEAGPVNLTISGEGYDVLPEMNLEKAISVYSPKDEIYIGTHEIFVNLSALPKYNLLKYALNYSGNITIKQICTNCSNASFYLTNLSYGQYELEIIASGKREMREKIRFALLEYLTFSREIECKKCSSTSAPLDAEVNISVILEASHNVSGVLSDYFPKEWALISNETIEEYSESHNALRFEVNGQRIVKKYTLRSPASMLPKEYVFQSEFEGLKSQETIVKVSRFLWFPLFLSSANSIPYFKRNLTFYKISPSVPLLLKFNSTILSLVAIYPKKDFGRVSGSAKMDDKKSEFEIISQVPNNQISSILVRIKINKNSLGDKEVFLQEIQTGRLANATFYSESDENVLYEAYLENKGKFKVVLK